MGQRGLRIPGGGVGGRRWSQKEHGCSSVAEFPGIRGGSWLQTVRGGVGFLLLVAVNGERCTVSRMPWKPGPKKSEKGGKTLSLIQRRWRGCAPQEWGKFADSQWGRGVSLCLRLKKKKKKRSVTGFHRVNAEFGRKPWR